MLACWSINAEALDIRRDKSKGRQMTDEGRPEYRAQAIDIAMSEDGSHGILVVNDVKGPVTIFMERRLLERLVERGGAELRRISPMLR